jgi:hypothetical protein
MRYRGILPLYHQLVSDFRGYARDNPSQVDYLGTFVVRRLGTLFRKCGH